MERQYKSGLEKISSKVKSGLILATAISALTLNSGCAHLRPPTLQDYKDRQSELENKRDYETGAIADLLGITTELSAIVYGLSR